MKNEPAFCDHCAEPIDFGTFHAFSAVPWDTNSAPKGESACLCSACVSDFKEQGDSEDEPENDGQPDWAQEWHDFDPDC